MTIRLLFSRNNAKIILLYNPTQEHPIHYITKQIVITTKLLCFFKKISIKLTLRGGLFC